ncbi:MAG: Gfo/Idh/MocA family protein [Thermoguttaceae bacterium]
MVKTTRFFIFCALTGLMACASAVLGEEADSKPIRLGIIGLDTSHVVNFTQYLNEPTNKTGCKVVAAYPGGSPDLPISANRLKGFTDTLRDKYHVEIVDSIETLCQKVDGVLLESVDGRVHLEQVKPVLAAKKPVFIDKPMANNLADAMEIYRLAKAAGVPCWTSSSWRFARDIRKVKKGKVGDVVGCMTYGPCPFKAPFPDLYWYGIHTTEAMFALMGPGCESVARTSGPQADVVVGRWKDGRIGIIHGGRPYKAAGDGFVAFCTKGVQQGRLSDGSYEGMLKELIEFFKTGKTPVTPQQTLEVLAFLSAAAESKAKGGCPVLLKDVLKEAESKISP